MRVRECVYNMRVDRYGCKNVCVCVCVRLCNMRVDECVFAYKRVCV